MQDQLAELVPTLKQAVSDFKSEQGLAEWAEPFIVHLASICMPKHQVEFRKRFDPQEEDAKENEPFLHDKLLASLQQFSELVLEVEQETSH